MTRTGIFNIWAAPWDWARTATAMAEVAWAAPAVIAARMPLIVAASISPCDADTRELTRMVTEKADAFRESSRVFSTSHRALGAALDANVRLASRLATGHVPGAADWFRHIDQSLAAFFMGMRGPGAMLRPVDGRVTANARRLRRRRRTDA